MKKIITKNSISVLLVCLLLLPFNPLIVTADDSYTGPTAFISTNGHDADDWNGANAGTYRASENGYVDMSVFVKNVDFDQFTFKMRFNASVCIPPELITYDSLPGLTMTTTPIPPLVPDPIYPDNTLYFEISYNGSTQIAPQDNGLRLFKLRFKPYPDTEGTLYMHLAEEADDFLQGNANCDLDLSYAGNPVDYQLEPYNDDPTFFAFTNRDRVHYFYTTYTSLPLRNGNITAIDEDDNSIDITQTLENPTLFRDSYGGYFFNFAAGYPEYGFDLEGYNYSYTGGIIDSINNSYYYFTHSMRMNNYYTRYHAYPPTQNTLSIEIVDDAGNGLGNKANQITNTVVYLEDDVNYSTQILDKQVTYSTISDNVLGMNISGPVDAGYYYILMYIGDVPLGEVSLHVQEGVGNSTGEFTSPVDGSTITSLTEFTGTSSDSGPEGYVMYIDISVHHDTLGWYNANTQSFQETYTDDCIFVNVSSASEDDWTLDNWILDLENVYFPSGNYTAYMTTNDGYPTINADTVSYTLDVGPNYDIVPSNGIVNMEDVGFLRQVYAETGGIVKYDFNGDGIVDILDFVMIMQNLTTP